MPTAILVTVGSGPGTNTPIVFSPRLEVKTSWLSSLTSAPATALRPATEKRYFAVEGSNTSTASLAVCAT
jgi:hypothetical protein